MHFGDTIFIFLLALVVFGPKKLPEIGRQIGKLMVEFRRASNDFKLQIEEELRSAEQAERQKALAAQTQAAAAEASVSSPEPSILPPSEGSSVSHAGGSDVRYENYNNEPPPESAASMVADADLPANTAPTAEAVEDPVAEAAQAAPLTPELTAQEPVSPNAERYYGNGTAEAGRGGVTQDQTPADEPVATHEQAPIHHV